MKILYFDNRKGLTIYAARVLHSLTFIGHGASGASCPRNMLPVLACTIMISSVFLGRDVPLFLFT